MKGSLRTPFKPRCAAHIPLQDSLPGTWDSSPPNSNIRQLVLEIQTMSEVRPRIPVTFSLVAPAGTLRDRNWKLYETIATMLWRPARSPGVPGRCDPIKVRK